MLILLISDNYYLSLGLKTVIDNEGSKLVTLRCSYERGFVHIDAIKKLDPDMILHDLIQAPNFKGLVKVLGEISDNVTAPQLILTDSMFGFFQRLGKYINGLKVINSKLVAKQIEASIFKTDNNTLKRINVRPSVKPILNISFREEQILIEMAKGRQMKHIASELKIDFRTASQHKANVMKKLSINTRVDFIKFILIFNELIDKHAAVEKNDLRVFQSF